MKILQDDLPLFPLQTVLFPQVRLPLHIFEPRYREMIERCLREDLLFGIVLIKQGMEVGGPAIPHLVGTLARVMNVARMDDGRMNIVVEGIARFRLLDQFHLHAYLSGRIELVMESELNLEHVEPLVAQVTQVLSEYVQMIQSLDQAKPDPLQLPQDPTMLSYLVAMTLPISALDKQVLLETPTTEERLRREVVLLRRELELLKLIIDRKEPHIDQGPFSLN